MGAANPVSQSEAQHALEVVSYLWQEYEYRHDMIWKLAFRITAVASALLIAPFLADESIQSAVGYGLLGLPLLALVVIAGGLFTLTSELPRLGLVRKAYRAAQLEALPPYVSKRELELGRIVKPKQGWFRKLIKRHKHVKRLWKRIDLPFESRVRVYCYVLLVAAIVYCVLFRFVWLPKIVDEAQHSQRAMQS